MRPEETDVTNFARSFNCKKDNGNLGEDAPIAGVTDLWKTSKYTNNDHIFTASVIRHGSERNCGRLKS